MIFAYVEGTVVSVMRSGPATGLVRARWRLGRVSGRCSTSDLLVSPLELKLARRSGGWGGEGSLRVRCAALRKRGSCWGLAGVVVGEEAFKAALARGHGEVAASAFKDGPELVGGAPEPAGEGVGEVHDDKDVVDVVHEPHKLF
jgi:hypothetical protein